jgi:hypothetical protein
MITRQPQKPSIEEWLHWGEVVVDQLTGCVHVYKKPPHSESLSFMPDAERQQKSDFIVKILRRLHPLLDQSTTPSDSIADAHRHDERTISSLTVIFNEALKNLTWLSSDMQKLLKSPWMSNFPNKAAENLFFGMEDESQGIGSGRVEHGRLPASLADLIEREEAGETRRPREEWLRQGEPRRHDVEARARWAEQNGKFLRSAGRVE